MSKHHSRTGEGEKQFFDDDILPYEVSVSYAARYLGVGRKVVYQLLDTGELRAVRERGRIIIDPCSLRDLRKSGRLF